jgi:hypothetical protein
MPTKNSVGRTPYERVMLQCEQDGACLVWTGYRTRGYGMISVKGKMTLVHRIVYEHHYGPLGDLHVDHVAKRGCSSKACCNIEHLEAVTLVENVMRGNGACAQHARKTHCIRGHELSGWNNLFDGKHGATRRKCRTCSYEATKRYERRQRERKTKLVDERRVEHAA